MADQVASTASPARSTRLRTELARAVVFAGAVVISELLLGDPKNHFTPLGDDLWLWHFRRIARINWSIPIHLAGFAWCHWVLFLHKDRAWPTRIFFAWSFFAAMEVLNFAKLRLFVYRPIFGETTIGLAAVVLLYVALVAVVVARPRIRET